VTKSVGAVKRSAEPLIDFSVLGNTGNELITIQHVPARIVHVSEKTRVTRQGIEESNATKLPWSRADPSDFKYLIGVPIYEHQPFFETIGNQELPVAKFEDGPNLAELRGRNSICWAQLNTRCFLGKAHTYQEQQVKRNQARTR
jgi:hypothetical protein